MNTFLSVALLTAILMLAWVIRTVAEKFMKAFRDTDSATDQTGWHGNRVRVVGNPYKKS